MEGAGGPLISRILKKRYLGLENSGFGLFTCYYTGRGEDANAIVAKRANDTDPNYKK